MWTLTFVCIALVLWLVYRKVHFSQLKKLGIPGPEANLLFGNLLELVSKTPLRCHDEWIKKYGNVVGYYFGTKPVVLVADVDLLKKIQISDFHKFMNRPDIVARSSEKRKGPVPKNDGFSQQLITLRDKRWKEIRSIITPSFTASKMKQMTPIMNEAIDSLLKNVEKKSSIGESFDIYTMYQGLTMDVIGRTAFGIQTDVQNDPNDPFLRTARLIFQGDIRNPLLILAGSFRSFQKIWTWISRLRLIFLNKGTNPIKELITSVKQVIAARRSNKQSRRPDLLQLMIDAEIDDLSTITSDDLTAKDDTENTEKQKASSSEKSARQMTDADILDNSILFFLAGYETTSTGLAFATHFLTHYPEVQEKIRKEVQQLLETEGTLDYSSVNKLQYLDQVWKESLRLYPPIYLFVSRECGEDMDIGNIHLKEGMAVQVPSFNLQRDPKHWGPDADKFKPERFSPENKFNVNPLAFQAFGGGPRNCVGMRFANMEAKLTLARLLTKYRLKPCEKTDKEEITLKVRFSLINPKNGIWVKAVPV